jgi:hypothetical protein
VSLALGPLGLVEALIVLGLVVFGMRRFPERTGTYLMGMSVIPVILLLAIVVRLPQCPVHGTAVGCYSSVTLAVLAVYVIVGIAGALITVRAWLRLRSATG